MFSTRVKKVHFPLDCTSTVCFLSVVKLDLEEEQFRTDRELSSINKISYSFVRDRKTAFQYSSSS